MKRSLTSQDPILNLIHPAKSLAPSTVAISEAPKATYFWEYTLKHIRALEIQGMQSLSPKHNDERRDIRSSGILLLQAFSRSATARSLGAAARILGFGTDVEDRVQGFRF